MEIKKKTSSIGTVTQFAAIAAILDHPEVEQSYRPLNNEHVGFLYESIKRDGLDTPLGVWDGGPDCAGAKDETGKFHKQPSFLISGNHRRAALRRLAKADAARFAELFPNGIPVIRRSGSLQDVLCAQVRENCARHNPLAEELLPQMQRLRDDFKMSGKQIAASIGKSASFVSTVFTVEEEVGDEGVEEIKKGGITMKEAIKATKKIKEAKKLGKKVDVKKVLKEAKSATSAEKSEGRLREKKRPSLSKLWAIYSQLPGLTMGQRVALTEAMIQFDLKLINKLPSELKLAKDKESLKPSKKAKVTKK